MKSACQNMLIQSIANIIRRHNDLKLTYIVKVADNTKEQSTLTSSLSTLTIANVLIIIMNPLNLIFGIMQQKYVHTDLNEKVIFNLYQITKFAPYQIQLKIGGIIGRKCVQKINTSLKKFKNFLFCCQSITFLNKTIKCSHFVFSLFSHLNFFVGYYKYTTTEYESQLKVL